MRYLCKRSGGVFVVLRVSETPNGFIKKRKHLRQLSKARAQSVSTEKGLPFFVLDIPSYTKDSDWERIAEKCGRYASRIVAPRSLSLPDFGQLKRFSPAFMPSLLVFNTALKIIGNSGTNPCGICITVTDRNAVHPSRIYKLLPFASVIRVVTSRPEKYAFACQKALDEYGASIVIRSAYEPQDKPEIVICCDGAVTPFMKSAAVFGYKYGMTGGINFYADGIEISEAHSEAVPDSIYPVDFAGAVTELCGSTEYKNSVFSDIVSDCNICDNPLPETCLRCFMQGRL